MSNQSDRNDGAASPVSAEAPPTTVERKNERPSVRPGGPESLIGTTLGGRYLIERLLGEGGMGAVYQAEHTHMHKRLAVKVLHPEMSRLPEVVARFEREAMAAAHIEHPNVAAATDFGKLDDGSFFLVLEYVEGKSLRDAIGAGPLDLGRALHIARQIASALARAHGLGIVHRDLKPENVMLVAREGDADVVKVLDFGIAKVPVGTLGGVQKTPGQALTQLGMVYGTPEYMAPEQALGQAVDARADLYALGVILFEMLSGVRPYDHESKVTLLGMHVTAPIPKVADRVPAVSVPPEIDALVAKLLAKEATARFADAKELIDAIDGVSAQLSARGLIGEMPAPLSMQSSRSTQSSSGAIMSVLGVGPTSLAQQRPGMGPLWPIEQRLAPLLRSAPAWVTPRRALVGASAVVGLLLVVIVTAARGGPAPTAGGTLAGSVYVPPPSPPDPKIDEVVAGAQAKLERGDYASAIDELSAVEKKHGDRSEVHMLLERAYTGVHNGHEAMREAGLWLSTDANASADPKLQEEVRNAALVRESADDAFSLLESKMGTRGLDILYDIAFGVSGRQYPQAATRARHSLDLQDVRSRASPALSVLLDFREAKTCDARKVLLDRAHDQGDGRLVSVLQSLEVSRGCGFLGALDCYPCLHKDRQLRDAIAAIQERASKSQ
jgi:eukaryotic-like serine/threonine-protein kinase